MIRRLLTAYVTEHGLASLIAEALAVVTVFALLGAAFAAPLQGTISGPNGTDELRLSTYVGDGTRIEILDAEDFRRAAATLAKVHPHVG
jgi:hypothetical protein